MQSRIGAIIMIIGVVLLVVGFWQTSGANNMLYSFRGNFSSWSEYNEAFHRLNEPGSIDLQIHAMHDRGIFFIWLGMIGAGIGGYLLYKEGQKKIS